MSLVACGQKVRYKYYGVPGVSPGIRRSLGHVRLFDVHSPVCTQGGLVPTGVGEGLFTLAGPCRQSGVSSDESSGMSTCAISGCLENKQGSVTSGMSHRRKSGTLCGVPEMWCQEIWMRKLHWRTQSLFSCFVPTTGILTGMCRMIIQGMHRMCISGVSKRSSGYRRHKFLWCTDALSFGVSKLSTTLDLMLCLLQIHPPHIIGLLPQYRVIRFSCNICSRVLPTQIIQFVLAYCRSLTGGIVKSYLIRQNYKSGE